MLFDQFHQIRGFDRSIEFGTENSTMTAGFNALGNNNINISDMTNKSRGDYAYSLLDIDSPVTDAAVEQLKGIEGVLKVRVIK